MKQPIGIFDSGVGGLTVFREIRKNFPYEDIIYFGDTARVPYGPKSRNTIVEYSVQNTRFLTQCGAKIIVVACNTSSAVALEHLQKNFSVPIVGVIESGAEAAVKATCNNKVGVIGTDGTIRSKAYFNAISALFSEMEIHSKSCPLFVSLVEEGWENHEVTEIIIREYLTPLLEKKIDTLVLGCTHYPILKPAIRKVVGNELTLIDSAEALAEQLQKLIPKQEIELDGKDTFFVSDNEEKFRKIASHILGRDIQSLMNVKLGESWYVPL